MNASKRHQEPCAKNQFVNRNRCAHAEMNLESKNK